MKTFFLALFVGSSLLTAFSTPSSDSLNNPVIRGELADPSLIRVGGLYYATGTSSEWAPHYPLYVSTDLVNWEQKGHLFEHQPEWTSHSFWAPELYYHNGKMFCYYTARRKSDNVSYIGVAVAEGTSLRFTDHGPLVELGTEAIDAFIFDNEGERYISWKAYGLDDRPIELLGNRLSDDGLHLVGDPFTLLRDEEGIGLEGQYHFRQGDFYYIIYSARSCCGPQSDYDVRVARSRNFKGPYEQYAGNPILKGGEGPFLSIGHGTAVKMDDGRYHYLSHAYLQGDAFYLGRQPVLHTFRVNDEGWVEFMTGREASRSQPFPLPGTVQKRVADFVDHFSGRELKQEWSWNFPYTKIRVDQKRGKLFLSGTPGRKNRQGTVLCVRPQTPHYSYEALFQNKQECFSGLTMYGDAENLVALGVKNGKILLYSVMNGEENILFERGTTERELRFRIVTERGRYLSCFFSQDGKSWRRVNEKPLDASQLVRWDRVARPGLIHKGARDAPAVIDDFVLTNL